jgi:HD-GYP domain-containing protein (c-di-GMP phosphodiesterase class II)
MTSARTYKKPMTPDEAIREIVNCSGTQFDPEIVKVFVKLMSHAVVPSPVGSKTTVYIESNIQELTP